SRAVAKPSEATNDNAREYIWADYAQPQQGGNGLNSPRNDDEFEGSHLARVRADAHRNKSLVIKAWGNLRGVMTGRQLTITDHPFYPVNRKYIVTGTKIEIVNNDSVTQGGEVKREYICRMKFWGVPSLHAYRIPLKAKKPRAFAETAVVTGYDRDPGVLTDPMARVRVKFIWDRRNKRTEQASCWIPLMQVWQGQRYGGLWLPRVGDHVYIGYVNSDPDRPFILGSHVTDYNKVPWDLYQNHALSGWRSQSLAGFGKGSNTVVSDDTPGQLQVQMTSDYANSRFVAGYNTRIDGDKGRTVARGEGIEIASDAHVVGRGNQGMLLTTEPREGASSPVKDMGETVARLTQARQQHEDLSQLAKKHAAQTPESSQADVVQDMKV
ncbi:type VI secretion system tip protein VgrG, partial [Paraburkholderia sp. J94]|uniref:type VI secretion system Vgr family protein n=1 Tax=Paraburkholderia sp. J94 TaxID=2805441 RepID=UPI002AB28B49